LVNKNRLDNLKELKQKPATGGDEKRVSKQHERGKLTAMERLELLPDSGSFRELDMPAGESLDDAVITGSGTIGGRKVFVYSQDFTVMGGSISEAVGKQVSRVMDMALKAGVPLVAINDSGGARIQEGVSSLCGVGDMLLGNTICSGVIPQISVVVGPSAGGAVYCPAITDFVFIVKGISQMYITGPDVVRAVTGEKISHQELGGAEVHAVKSGVAHFIHDNEKNCFEEVKRLLDFLPQSNREGQKEEKSSDDSDRTDDSLSELVPEDPKRAYDMKKLITSIADNGDFLEVHKDYAKNIIVGFIRLDGTTAGVVAQQPSHLAGVIDIDASVKAARFVRFCDAFNIPLVSLVDVPGFMPGINQEHGGIIRHGAKLIYAYAEATVPKITVITRKAYGGAYIVMSSRHLRGDLNYAWPSGEIAVMGAEGAVNIIYRKVIAESDNPEETRKKLVQQYREQFNNPVQAVAKGYIDDIINPAETRPVLIKALKALKGKKQYNPQKKHGNIPL